MRKPLVLLIGCALFLSGCGYIVVPDVGDATAATGTGKGWSAVATNVGKSEKGDFHVDIAIRNDTGEWSSMQAASKPATLTGSDGKTTSCPTVWVGTGGTTLAPGFQMHGYTGGTKAKPTTQLLYVECPGATAGAKLSLDYSYATGEFNYYLPAKPTQASLTVDLAKVASDLKYPVATAVDNLVEKAGAKITAINNCPLSLTGVERTATGLKLSWHTENPTADRVYVHIGTPPVLGADGIVYGIYESPSLNDPPITPAGQSADWTTEVAVPSSAKGLYVLVQVESKQQKLFVSHAIDITDK